MGLLYKPTYSPTSPEFLQILDYLKMNSGGVLASPTISDALIFSGPEGSYEDIQIQFSAPTSLPPFKAPTGFDGNPQPRSLTYSASIDLLVRYPNVALVECSSPNSALQWFPYSPRNPVQPVLQDLAITIPPVPPQDGNLWLGPKQTGVGHPDQIGDRRYSAPTDSAQIGATTTYSGLVWTKESYQSLFSSGVRIWWQATSLA